MLIDSPDRAHHTSGVGHGHVDFLVYRVGRAPRVIGYHLGGASRRSQQEGVDTQLRQRLDERRHQRGLSRASIALEQEHRPGVLVIEEPGHTSTGIPLSTGGVMWKAG